MHIFTKRHGLSLDIVAIASAALFLCACLGSVLDNPITAPSFHNTVSSITVISDVSADKGLISLHGVGPREFNRGLKREIEKCNLFDKLFFERDLSTKGVQQEGSVFLVKFRLEEHNYNYEMGAGTITILCLSWLILPSFFLGLARNPVNIDMEVRMKIYDVTNSKVERVKDEVASEFFNAFDISALTPLTTKTYLISTEYSSGWDNLEESKKFNQQVNIELVRNLINKAQRDIIKVIR